jgi:hypothetical protein
VTGGRGLEKRSGRPPTASPAAFRAYYFDAALIADPPALRAVADIAGIERLVFGSDWPFAGRLYPPSGDSQPAPGEVFSPEERGDRTHERAGRLARGVRNALTWA